ncbi:hypothetical protein [Streptomyces griseochromogenes]|uniref:hypothetical protein n=1 Tax=Streptomyces griseochromogenes TaxID=68214 RepID=UPI0037A047DA
MTHHDRDVPVAGFRFKPTLSWSCCGRSDHRLDLAVVEKATGDAVVMSILAPEWVEHGGLSRGA